MLNVANDSRSLSDFKRKTSELLERLKKTSDPLILTINGKAELVVQDAVAYQQLLARAQTFNEGGPNLMLDAQRRHELCSISFAESMASRVEIING